MSYVTKLTIDSTKVAADATDYPVYVDLSDMNAEFWSTVADNTNTHALDLDGASNQSASITDASQTGLDIGAGSFTFEAWIKPESSTRMAIVAKGSPNDANSGYTIQYRGDLANDPITLTIDDGDDGVIDAIIEWDTNGDFEDGNWHHIAVSTDRTNHKCYFGGVLQTASSSTISDTTSTMTNTDPFYIGRLGNSSTLSFDGQIDDVRFWDDIRTADEIRGNMHKELAGTETNLQGYWKLNNDYTDETSNGNDLTASGSPVFTTSSAFKTTAGDVRIFKSDGTTELAREVLKDAVVNNGDGTGTGELHFKYTGTLSSSVDTEVQIHADGTSADYATTDTYGAENVWATNNKLTLHMEGNSTDSTSSSNDGTDTAITYAAGKIEDSASFNGSTSTISAGNDTSLQFSGDFTASTWFKMPTDASNRTLIDKETFGGSGNWSGWDILKKTDNILRFEVLNTGSTGTAVNSNSTIPNDVWTLVHAVKESGTLKMYINGSLQTDTKSATMQTDTATNLTLGTIDGELDETRIYNGTALSADWITTEYNNQNSPSTFYTAEDPIITLVVDQATINATGQTVNLSVLMGTLIVEVANMTATGIQATLTQSLRLAVDYASMTASGIAVTLKPVIRMVVDYASMTAIGISAGLRRLGWRDSNKSDTEDFTETTKSSAPTWTE